MKSARRQIQPRFRVLRGRDIALGPGKAELLEQVQRAGSIAEAAKQMDMSYMRAWMLIKTMERCFKQPLLKVARGGAKKGGAQLTANGRRVIELYREMERRGMQATRGTRDRIISLLKT